MKTAIALLCLLAAAPAAAQDCTLPVANPRADGWVMEQSPDDGWSASHEVLSLTVLLTVDAPVTPLALDWYVPPELGSRVGLLRYFSGEPGTYELTVLERTAVIDLESGLILAAPISSANCVPTVWTWYEDRLEVDDGHGGVVVELPAG
ncbi:hypothetical protein [Pelagovum pacificum]|uniref:Uncharacterized protein n=1 Tax=Pelagovum pacificum TaxID=2588711 RepID=A0A5C5G7Y8_9RHOB|nr:hypothetical protein [Pelagovum pacificum]QQA41539.1 hypothetical protein I8N54_11960 [Pelagovum pacificum]TNY30819.1 hypothetical protein FHY64_17035 [Pelagovum pacificum]